MLLFGLQLSYSISFLDFIVYMAPGAIIASIPAAALLLWLYRATLMGAPPPPLAPPHDRFACDMPAPRLACGCLMAALRCLSQRAPTHPPIADPWAMDRALLFTPDG